MPAITKTLRPRTRSEWRAWLRRYHARTREIWLLLAKRHLGAGWLSYEDAICEALCFGWIDGVVKRFDADFRAIRLTPRRAGSVWSELNKRRVGRLLRAGLIEEPGLAQIRIAKKNGQWALAKHREAPVAPPDLLDALARQPAASRHFEALPPSYRKMWIAWVVDAKRSETRARRIDRVVTQASAGLRPGV